MLGHLVAMEDLADLEADFRLALQGRTGALHPIADGGEIALGGQQQLLALVRPAAGQLGIAADHQPLAGIVGRGDGGHVALVEQVELEGAAV